MYTQDIPTIRVYTIGVGSGTNAVYAISYRMIEIGSAENAGRTIQHPHPGVQLPGSLANGTYVRTNTSELPSHVQLIADSLWTTAVHTAYEAHLRG